eukprot:Colp12_sorted_trinity150504_noHs@2487
MSMVSKLVHKGIGSVLRQRLLFTTSSIMEAKRCIIVGDVHACVDELKELVEKVGYKQGEDRLICVGDYVAKGPSSGGVIDYLREIKAEGVRGNHDWHVMRWREQQKVSDDHNPMGLNPQGEHRKLARTLTEEQIKWLEERPLYLEIPEHNTIVVHAGAVPGVPMTEQDPENLMFIRGIREDGSATKEGDGTPWAQLWKGPQTIVFGHDAVRKLQDLEFAKGLDTGCVYGGQLTAYILPEKKFVSVQAKQMYEVPKPKKPKNQ